MQVEGDTLQSLNALPLSVNDSEAKGLFSPEKYPGISKQGTHLDPAQLQLTTPQLCIPLTASSFSQNITHFNQSCFFYPKCIYYFGAFTLEQSCSSQLLFKIGINYKVANCST